MSKVNNLPRISNVLCDNNFAEECWFYLSSKVGDDVHDHVTGSQVSSETDSKRDSPREEGDLRRKQRFTLVAHWIS